MERGGGGGSFIPQHSHSHVETRGVIVELQTIVCLNRPSETNVSDNKPFTGADVITVTKLEAGGELSSCVRLYAPCALCEGKLSDFASRCAQRCCTRSEETLRSLWIHIVTLLQSDLLSKRGKTDSPACDRFHCMIHVCITPETNNRAE